ncbi:hypothetical protein NLJ89_g3757 [Agrocybe chaxingu]|uniref:Methionine aminopeptidase n=1 Tax=Agrocybe chaxingu TaxID=84603 RepID=A0A9W8K1W1_9AGAR|nr:hypothetical protein NLJ89_g3757 [Agrocybe chaxingu]
MSIVKLRLLGLSSRTWTRSNSSSHKRVLWSTFRIRQFSTEQEVFEDFGEYSVILPEEPFVFGVSHIKPRTVPAHVKKPPYALPGGEQAFGIPKQNSGKIPLGGVEESLLAQAGSLAKKVRQFAGTQVKVLDRSVQRPTKSILRFSAFVLHKVESLPATISLQLIPLSINNIAVHGIPDDRKLENGDIINIDVTIYLNGYHGDTSETFLVGDVDEPGKELVQVTNEALSRAIGICGPGRPFKDIGRTIHEYLLDKDYSVSSTFTGHGIGKVFHDNPAILHHLNDEPGVMEPGHCFTIEPVIIQGRNPKVWIFPDGWTASTENCARSAQAEHMVLITNDGIKVLTR